MPILCYAFALFFSVDFQQVRNVLKIVKNKLGLYCFCIYIRTTIVK